MLVGIMISGLAARFLHSYLTDLNLKMAGLYAHAGFIPPASQGRTFHRELWGILDLVAHENPVSQLRTIGVRSTGDLHCAAGKLHCEGGEGPLAGFALR